jgi:hypothetical protein
MAARRTCGVEGLKGFYRGLSDQIRGMHVVIRPQLSDCRVLAISLLSLRLNFPFLRFSRYLKYDSLSTQQKLRFVEVLRGHGAAFTTTLDVLKTRIMLDIATS